MSPYVEFGYKPYHISGQSCENATGKKLPSITAPIRRAILPSLVKFLDGTIELVLPQPLIHFIMPLTEPTA